MSQLQFQVPSGKIAVTWNDRGQLTSIQWCYGSAVIKSSFPIPKPIADAVDRMRGYFDQGQPIGEVPWEIFDQSGWSEFQGAVYKAIVRIPHGETRTYSWVAARVGKLSATRAVGQALRKNPFPILIPCHRVVAQHSLGGFMGASDPEQPEMRLKQKLISLEEEYLNPVFPFLTLAIQ